MRGRIIEAISKKPQNANQLAATLKVDYKTVQHHLGVLIENNVFSVVNKGGYGAVYFISPQMEENFAVFEGIWRQFGKS